MFYDADIETLGFSSSWKFSRSSEEVCTQTKEVIGNDKIVQSKDYHPATVQTDERELQPRMAVYDEAKLATFLGKIFPEVMKELDRVSHSNAFALYELATDTQGEVREVLRQTHQSIGEVKVIEVSWSCTGSVLAVALSHTLHASWCSHQGLIAFYNIDREKKTASCMLEASSCIRSISMHPYLASIVAAGTYSGEVLVWDTAEKESNGSLLNTSHTSHNDSVAQVRWVIGTNTVVTLVSSGLDGQLFFWKVSPQLSSYEMVERYVCDPSSVEKGVICFAFPYHKQDTFVVALEGGALVQCSISAAKPNASVCSSETPKTPVISSFEHPLASVLSMEFSPYDDELFATVSTDQAIRTYSLFQNCPQHVIWGSEGQAGLGWVPALANLLLIWGGTASVTLYNSQSGEKVITLSPEKTENKALVSASAFNPKSPRILAVGDLEGTVQVWEVPSVFPTQSKHL